MKKINGTPSKDIWIEESRNNWELAFEQALRLVQQKVPGQNQEKVAKKKLTISPELQDSDEISV